MSCSSPFGFTPRDSSQDGVATGAEPAPATATGRRRRHSHFIPRRKSIVSQIMEGEEGLLIKLDLFLTELERRLDYLESFGDLTLDASISRAYSTLQAVRTRCSQVSEGVIGAGRHRLQVMVDTLEARYQEALEATGSLNEKARIGLDLLDGMLSDFEAQAYKLRERGLSDAASAAGVFMGEGRRVVDEGLGRAREVVDEGLERAREVVDEGIGRAIRAAETMEEHIQRAIAIARERGGLIKYDDLPVPWRVNPHILDGYRFTDSKLGCVRSMFGLSNELVNIWSHTIGLVLVLALAFYFYPASVNFHLSTRTDVFIAAVFFFAACQCLICSTVWHTMNAVADVDLISTFACVDYTGISLLVAASIMTTEWTAFYCEPVSRWIYITTTALLGIGGVLLPWHPTFNRPELAWARVGFYVCLGATGFIPMFQIAWTRGLEFVFEFYSPIAKSLCVYVGGACIYASKIPERWCPGMFDYIGGSHNLWHMAVLGGILFHFSAMQEFFSDAFRRAQDGCPVY